MLYIIAHLFIVAGQEKAFHDYEQRALSLFQSHGGELLLACRPETRADMTAPPAEIHVLRIGSREAFRRFQADPRLAALQGMRRRAVTKTELFFSSEPITYECGGQAPLSAGQERHATRGPEA